MIDDMLYESSLKRALWPKRSNLHFALISLGLNVFNSAGFMLFSTDDDTRLYTFIGVGFIFLICFPCISFLLGAGLAFLPYREVSYRDKYFRFSFLTLFALSTLTTLLIALASITLIGGNADGS